MFSFSGSVVPIEGLIAIAATAGLFILASIGVYRLYFHPYAKYPGPFIAKLTSWYSIYHTYHGDLHIDIWECHNKYGKVIRYGPNRILVNTTEGLKAIYSHGKNTQKAAAYRKVSLVPGVHPTFSMIDNQGHAKLRRLVGQGLSNAHIRAYDEELRQSALLFAARLGESSDHFEQGDSDSEQDGWTAPKNVASWSNFFTFDVMSHLVYGTSYELLTYSDNHWVIDGVLGQMRRISFLTMLPELEDMRMDRLLFRDARKKAFRFSLKSKEIMEARKIKGKEAGQEAAKVDLFSKLLAAKDPETGESLSDKQLWAESNLMIIAGSDTSSTGIAASFFYLSRNPSTYDRVTKEVRSTIMAPENISQGPKLLSCNYLRACILESMRLSPPAGGVMWRQATPEGFPIESDTEMHIPGGGEVGTGIYAIHHNQEYYPEPFKFRPERWLPEEVGEEAVAVAHSAFHTFSMGPRSCPGRNLAMLEIQFALAAVIVNYDFRKVESRLGDVGEGRGKFAGQYQTFWAFTSLKDGPYIQFKKLSH
ncbi:cytochrome P450 monooxygenase [Fusarium beomiforme]|uniref:Cytochrome P450 monooxygenase n=1 Tax=Fusarium beomiforme TaxID=44412 RepID=A0A9P5A7S0_9HYPO|nr:cytochrome P450 monooxygenase [Fusarium beomiforme]